MRGKGREKEKERGVRRRVGEEEEEEGEEEGEEERQGQGKGQGEGRDSRLNFFPSNEAFQQPYHPSYHRHGFYCLYLPPVVEYPKVTCKPNRPKRQVTS